MNVPRYASIAVLLSLATAQLGCSSDAEGKGSLQVKASGEEASVSGYPVGEGEDQIAFVDGWSLELNKVVVSISDFRLRTQDGDDARVDADPVVIDLHRGEPELWTFEDVPAQRWDRVGYRYQPPGPDVRVANDVDPDDLARMQEEGWSLLVGATASRDDRTVALEYGFPFEVTMDKCHSGVDDTDGVVIATGAAAEAQITIHLDHLFFDSWAIEEPDLRFEAMAAMVVDDGVLTLEDLAAQDNLTDMLDGNGDPLDLAYDPGSGFDPVPDNLRDFVIAGATTTGHFNGEGHCDYERTK